MTSIFPEIDSEQCWKYDIKMINIVKQNKEKRSFLFRLFRFVFRCTFYPSRFVLWAIMYRVGLNVNRLMSERMRAFAEADR